MTKGDMMENFNGLTPAETERLALMAEECGEVVQIINKILRHGYESYNPKDPNRYPNRNLLEKELGDAIASMNLMVVNGDVNEDTINLCSIQKSLSVAEYLHHNKPLVEAN